VLLDSSTSLRLVASDLASLSIVGMGRRGMDRFHRHRRFLPPLRTTFRWGGVATAEGATVAMRRRYVWLGMSSVTPATSSARSSSSPAEARVAGPPSQCTTAGVACATTRGRRSSGGVGTGEGGARIGAWPWP
jgi:hypothetical protein